MKKYTVTEEEARQRLDIFIGKLLPEVSRAYIQKLTDSGKIIVNSSAVKAGYRLKAGDVVTIDYDVKELGQVPSISLPLLYEDDDCIVINKPTGVLTHARGAFSEEATVASFLRHYTSGMNGERAGIVHRLDRATSGVMICAKNNEALSWLQKQFAQRRVKKTYIALVGGHLRESEAIIDMPIERNPKAPTTFRVGINGKPAKTHYSLIATNNHYSLLELTPETGRTHQLRVHLAQLGHPIVGDLVYGGETAERLFLHALKLEITLPNRKRMTFEANLPSVFKHTMKPYD